MSVARLVPRSSDVRCDQTSDRGRSLPRPKPSRAAQATGPGQARNTTGTRDYRRPPGGSAYRPGTDHKDYRVPDLVFSADEQGRVHAATIDARFRTLPGLLLRVESAGEARDS